MKNNTPVETAIQNAELQIAPVRFREMKHDPHCDCGICQYCGGQEDVYGNSTACHHPAHEQQITSLAAALAAEQEKTKEYEADRLMLEDMFRVDGRLEPDYEQGWNDAIKAAIEKFGRNAWVQEREAMLDEALQDEGTITTLNAKVKRMEDALEQANELILGMHRWHPTEASQEYLTDLAASEGK